MPWEQRGRQRYFYHCRRIHGKVVKEYYGKGRLAEAMDLAFQARQEARRARRENLTAVRQQCRTADQVVEQLEHAAGLAMASRINYQCAALEDQVMTPFRTAEEAVARCRHLMALYTKGDQAVEPELRTILDRYPELWVQFGNLGEQAILYWVNLIAGSNPLHHEAIRHKLRELRAELEAGTQDAASRLLVDRVLATWLQLTHADSLSANAGDIGGKGLEFLTRRQNQAQQRHLSALRAWRQWQQFAADLPGSGAGRAEPTIGPKLARKTDRTDEDGPWILPFPKRSA